MVVTNAQHETAVVIRRDGETVVFVRFTAGKLVCERLTELGFREHWKESHLALGDTLIGLSRTAKHMESPKKPPRE